MVTSGFPRKQLFPGQSVSGALFTWGKLLYSLPPWARLKSEVEPVGLEGSHCVFSVSWNGGNSSGSCSAQWPWQRGPPKLTLDFGLHFPEIFVIPGQVCCSEPWDRPREVQAQIGPASVGMSPVPVTPRPVSSWKQGTAPIIRPVRNLSDGPTDYMSLRVFFFLKCTSIAALLQEKKHPF